MFVFFLLNCKYHINERKILHKQDLKFEHILAKKNKNKMDQPHLGSWIQSHLKLYLIHKTISELKCFLVLLEEIKFLNSLSREMKTVAGDRVVAL